MSVIDTASAEHYKWGTASEGWRLLDRPELSVIKERVPAGDRDRRHYHSEARQFFYILEGEAAVEIDDSHFVLRAGQGIEIRPRTPHQFMNESAAEVVFLVVSAPRGQDDRNDL